MDHALKSKNKSSVKTKRKNMTNLHVQRLFQAATEAT